MKKTITVNLGGRAFLITEEAYNSLNDYLDSLATSFKGHDSAGEIIADIEARISELCEKRLAQSHGNTIELDLVNEMINRMGKPEAMMPDEENTADENNGSTDNEEKGSIGDNIKNIFDKMDLNKKYYLDTDDRMLGGVISGLAAYFRTDVTLLRILALIAIIATGILGIVIYLIVWCIAPTASNTSEKLKMQGIEPTPENIAETITGESPATENNTPTKKDKNNLRLALFAAIIFVAVYVYKQTIFSININDTTINGTVLLSILLLIAFFIQKTGLPQLLKTILTVAITLFALFAIFVIMMTTLR
ncbi:MAG: PspC domain-containing protein [Bacteroidaceae bacterium]|nr:PspC domain-containing protein [Bacteroidaceae bacterium]